MHDRLGDLPKSSAPICEMSASRDLLRGSTPCHIGGTGLARIGTAARTLDGQSGSNPGSSAGLADTEHYSRARIDRTQTFLIFGLCGFEPHPGHRIRAGSEIRCR